jgi:uncharacterized protein YqjF (DUF2071 family)
MPSLLSRRTRLALAWFCFIIHVLAVAVMILSLQYGLLLGTAASRRATILALGPLWQLGWFVWMLASLALVLLFIAWADTLEYKVWGYLAAALCLAGATIDWLDETLLAGVIPGLAATDPSGLFELWEHSYRFVSIGLANGLYTVGGLLLTGLAFKTPGYPRWLAWLGVPVWGFSVLLSAFGFLDVPPGIILASAGIFVFFLPWTLLLGFGWLQKSNDAHFDPGRVSFLNTLRSMIPRHPVPMTTVFRECLLVNFAVDPQVMRPLVPAPFELELHGGCAYLSVVIAEMVKMCPSFVPRLLGITYNQVVYRVVVNYAGERGVYFVRSDANNQLMSIAGELLTFFHFHYSRCRVERRDGVLHVDLIAGPSGHADIHAAYPLAATRESLPATSHFTSLAGAKEFLVQLFTAFSYDSFTNDVGIVRIRRGEWDLRVVDDTIARYEFMQDGRFFPSGSAQIDSIFYVKELPYFWHRLQVKSASDR